MKLLLATLAATALVGAFFLPAAVAQPELPACVGYESCYRATGNGFAIFCVKNPKSGYWMCGECEACGNGPWGLP